MKYDWLIVGAGFTGAVIAERLASQRDQKILVIDRRNHIAGNAYDAPDEQGILVHHYGPHIFHTASKKIWDYLSGFTAWRPYFHHVLGMVDGHAVPVPFNLNALYALLPPHMADTLSAKLIAQFGFGTKVPILKMQQTADAELNWLANYVYEKVFLGYTVKQWGLKPEELDAAVTGRVPVHISRDDRYFQDPYQAMPSRGYTALMAKILDHPNIRVELNTEFRDVPKDIAPRTVFTGPIDEFFAFEDGELPYRSLRFEFVTEDRPQFQAVAQVNYPNEFDFTRITESKHFYQLQTPRTVLTYEYPQAYQRGVNLPYYPIPAPDSKARLAPYLAKAEALKGRCWFAGRLADYQYYNMDQACARALSLFEKELAQCC